MASHDALNTDATATAEDQATAEDFDRSSSTTPQQYYSGAPSNSLSPTGQSLRPHPLEGSYVTPGDDDTEVECKRSRIDDDVA